MAKEYTDIKSWDLTKSATEPPQAPTPNAEWALGERTAQQGTAWVYYGKDSKGNVKTSLTRPVILSDGFHGGNTKLDELWYGLESRPTASPYGFISDLRGRGYDLIILGYQDCTASILNNATLATECILKAIAERSGEAPLAVGGFSMGGIITRYALARLESQHVDHQTATYICYDSPHLGAWIPIALQAMALSLGATADTYKMITSDAARQLLWRHLPAIGGTPVQDAKRTALLSELKAVGDWPMRPRKIGVANGKGEGNNGIPPGIVAVSADGVVVRNVRLYTQPSGENELVAKVGMLGGREQRTSGMPEADGAHGGKLEGFGLAYDQLKDLGGAVCNQREHGFVPTGSAIAVTGSDPWTKLDASVLGAPSALDDFKCASQNEAHTLMTRELGSWILERIDQQQR